MFYNFNNFFSFLNIFFFEKSSRIEALSTLRSRRDWYAIQLCWVCLNYYKASFYVEFYEIRNIFMF